jgi:hypothetical protein
MQQARDRVPAQADGGGSSGGEVRSKAEIKGVAYFDFFHNQTGVADNEIELHPILSFRCLSG